MTNTITVADAFDGFILAKRAENVMPGTLYLYNRTMELWRDRWPDVTMEAITADHVRRFIVWLQGQDEVKPERQFSSQSVNIHWRNLRAFMRWCHNEQLIANMPLKNVKAPRMEEVVPDMLTEFEAFDLLQSVRLNDDANAFRDYVIDLFFLTTGVRLAELAGLNVDDVNLQVGFAKVRGKGRRERIVPLFDVLPLEVKRYLLKHRRAQPGERALFVSRTGTRMKAASIQQHVIDHLANYVPRELNRVGPHTYRHTAATFLLRRLRDIKTVATILGHSNLETTERYTHLSFDDISGVQRPTLDALLSAKRQGRAKPRLLLLEKGS